MAAGPTPTSRFRVWGQALYRIKPTEVNKINPAQHRLLFAVSDEQQEWLAWYYFSGDRAIDYVLLAGKRGVDHEVVGIFGGKPTLLNVNQHMMVDELAGPIMWSRRKQWAPPKNGSDGSRRATIWSQDHWSPDSTFIHLGMTLMHDTGKYQFEIKVKKVTGFHGKSIGRWFSERGFLNYVMTEPFRYPTPHLNQYERLKVFEHNLTHEP